MTEVSAIRISVIIPCLNERRNISRLLRELRSQARCSDVIVVDGGSSDGTAAAARAAGARVLTHPPGRGGQIAAGAALSRGEVLLFLHADCRFPAGGLAAIEAFLEDRPDCPGGNFRLLFDGDSGFSRWLTGFYAWLRTHGLYYGDSGIFVRRQVYRSLGGIRPIALMEDYDFSRRLERAGPTCCIAEPPLTTSSRRFQKRWPLAIFLGWLVIHLLYHLGLPPDQLARLYRSRRHAPGAGSQRRS